MFPDFNTIKSFYSMKLWTKGMVADAVKCGHITADQYKEITSQEVKLNDKETS